MLVIEPKDESCIQLFHHRDGKGYRVQMLGQERARTTRGYDPNEPKQLYLDNRDGSLHPVGIAGHLYYDVNIVCGGIYHPSSQPSTPYQGQPSPEQQM
jgi:hypothetical protein